MFLIIATVLSLSACSEDDPESAAAPSTDSATETSARSGADGPAVARVGDVEISRAAYERFVRRTAAGYAKARTLPGRTYYVPPKYALCIRNRREWGSVPKSWPAARVRIQCRHNHQRLRTSLLTAMIQDEWLEEEAGKQGVAVPVDETARLTELPAQLAESAVAKANLDVSDADVARYYRQHRSYLRKPEERWWRAVLSDTEARAGQARQALAAGASWEKAARRYNDPASGTLPLDSLSSPGGNDPPLEQPIFTARRGELVGPVATQAGFYILSVERIAPPRQYSLRQSRTAIEPVLETRRKEDAQIAYWRAMRLAARERTMCLTAVVVPECSNGPRRRFDPLGGSPFGHTNPRPTLPPPPPEPEQAQDDAQAPAVQ
jgi:foldase protein PrsA